MYRIFVYYDDEYDFLIEKYHVYDIYPNDVKSSLKFIEFLSILGQNNNFKCKRIEIIFISEGV